jgi:hypothetical protein
METLAKRWMFSRTPGGDWLLRAKPDKAGFPNNRAYITPPDNAGIRTLYVYAPHKWVPHCESSDLRALKAIGRMEAARRLNDEEIPRAR